MIMIPAMIIIWVWALWVVSGWKAARLARRP
jgi:hypothetical protein